MTEGTHTQLNQSTVVQDLGRGRGREGEREREREREREIKRYCKSPSDETGSNPGHKPVWVHQRV